MRTRHACLLAALGPAVCAWPACVWAESGTADKEPTGLIGPTTEQPYSVAPRAATANAAATRKTGEWVLAPVPGHNPSQGLTLTVVAQYIFKPQGQSAATPPSILGAAGLYTQERSRGGALGYRGSLLDDEWRVQAFAGAGRYNFDFYGIGEDAGERGVRIPVRQSFRALQIQAVKRIADGVYLGPRLIRHEVHLATDSNALPLDEQIAREIGKDISGAALGLRMLWDTRDNTFSPTTGHQAQARMDWYRRGLGGDNDFQLFDLEFNQYRRLNASHVLAWRGYLRQVSGQVPFFELSSLGGTDLRGYQHGRYSDRTLLATQAELRWQWTPRWGFAAFAGVGAVAPTLGRVFDGKAMWSAGLGTRLRIAKDNPVHLRLDWAVGRDGSGFYLAVGEAF